MSITHSQLECRKLSYEFRGIKVLDSVSMAWTTGVHAILGPNGAGKSTLFSLVALNRRLQQGVVLLNGKKVVGRKTLSVFRRSVAFLPQECAWSGRTNVGDFLDYFAVLRGVKRDVRAREVARSIEEASLRELVKRDIRKLSGGERRRVFIAQCLVSNPQVLILDEPTAGLDPEQCINLREVIQNIAKERVVIISTHIIEDVISLQAHTSILDAGRVVWQGEAKELETLSRVPVSASLPGTLAELGYLSVVKHAGSN